MSIRNSLLALLSAAPAHGYGLKSIFEAGTAGAWPLNVGQVYTTLSRLERDGMVEPVEDSDDDRRAWRITDDGRVALAAWYEVPVDHRSTRDELVIKVLVAVAAGDVDVAKVIQTQRVATMERLQQYTRHKMAADPAVTMPWVMLLDALILRAEAESRWLDRCEERLGMAAASP